MASHRSASEWTVRRITDLAEIRGSDLWRLGRSGVMAVIVLVNLIGVVIVVAISTVVVPLPEAAKAGRSLTLNLVGVAVYVTLVVPLAAWIGTRRLRRLRDWLVADRPATDAEKRLLLEAPLHLFRLQLTCWLVAAAAFGGLNALEGALLGVAIAVTVSITGATTAACSYLLAELLMRVAAARALVDGVPSDLAIPGVATRAVLAWALGTGLPVAGLVFVGLMHVLDLIPATASQLAVAIIVLGGVGLIVGLLAVTLAARATATPIDDVRDALTRVRAGEFDHRVPVFDGTQIGQLQVGFNEMAEGLAERERIRSAFGTYVDPDIAERVARQGVSLEADDADVSVLFVDVRGFTSYAETVPPEDAVRTLNHLFAVAVPIVLEHGGRIDKFIGDGLMAVFGAPQPLDDHAERALAAALDIDAAVRLGRAGDVAIGMGINSGHVIAGTIGTTERLEFSVIGDTVNVAARAEAATRQTGDVILVTDATRRLVGRSSCGFEERAGVELKGKRESVRLHAPVLGSPPAPSST